MHLKSIVQMIPVLLITFGITVCFSKEKERPYLSQTSVDTLVQQAYNALNATEEISRAAPSRQDAILQAKKIVQKLKSLAEGDPNKKYILWKTGELESQIYLEENGMLLEKNQKQRKAVNIMIGQFNEELARKRPDFSRLSQLCGEMKAASAAKAGELRLSYDDRRKNIGREVVLSIEQAVERGDFDKAREDLVYCNTYQEFMGVSQTSYSLLAGKVQARVTVESEEKFIRDQINKGYTACNSFALADAHGALVVAQIRLNGIKEALIQRMWDKLFFSCRRLEKTIEQTEDSLVSVAQGLLRDKGVGEASAYVDNALRKAQVSSEKIAKVNFAILEKAVAARKPDTSAIGREIVAVVETPKDTGSPMTDILAVAREKAKNPQDTAARPSMAHLTYTERVRIRNLQLAQEGKRQREERMNKDNRDKANAMLVSVYALLEQGKRKQAVAQFAENQKFLKEYLLAEAYAKLEGMVNSEKERMK